MQSSATGGVCSKTEFLSQRFERLETCGLQVGLPPFCPLSFHFWFIFRFLFLFRSSSSLSSSNFLFLPHVLTCLSSCLFSCSFSSSLTFPSSSPSLNCPHPPFIQPVVCILNWPSQTTATHTARTQTKCSTPRSASHESH